MNAVDRQKAESGVVHRENGHFERIHAAALILLFALVVIAPRTRSWTAFVCVYAASTIVWLFIQRASLPAVWLVVVTLLLRLPFIASEPRLSADVYRYMWDGQTLASGVNPYEVLPADPRVNHAEIRTIYPPHAEMLFAAVHQLQLWRLLLIALDVAVVLLARGSPAALAYATCPIVVFEGSWSGHVDLVAGFLMLLAWQRRSAFATALAAGMKLTPLAAVPAICMRSGRPVRFMTIFAITLLVPFAAFAMWGDVMPGLREYAMRWIFNSPAYDAGFAVVEGLDAATTLKSIFAFPFVYRFAYTDFIVRGILAVCAIAAITWRRRSPIESIAALLLLAPAVHPWYWLVIAPLALTERHPATWLILCAPFSYLLYEGVSKGLVYLLCYALPLAIIALPRLSAIWTSGAGSLLAAMRPRIKRDTSRP